MSSIQCKWPIIDYIRKPKNHWVEVEREIKLEKPLDALLWKHTRDKAHLFPWKRVDLWNALFYELGDSTSKERKQGSTREVRLDNGGCK